MNVIANKKLLKYYEPYLREHKKKSIKRENVREYLKYLKKRPAVARPDKFLLVDFN